MHRTVVPPDSKLPHAIEVAKLPNHKRNSIDCKVGTANTTIQALSVHERRCKAVEDAEEI